MTDSLCTVSCRIPASTFLILKQLLICKSIVSYHTGLLFTALGRNRFSLLPQNAHSQWMDIQFIHSIYEGAQKASQLHQEEIKNHVWSFSQILRNGLGRDISNIPYFRFILRVIFHFFWRRALFTSHFGSNIWTTNINKKHS